MSVSPPIRRMSSTSSSSREDLINQYEAEEERIINVLSRKLEQLREEKIELENALEAESESQVNRLSREISALRLAQVQTNGTPSDPTSPVETRVSLHTYFGSRNSTEPTAEAMLDAMRRENEQLRSRLVTTERDYVRITRLNEVYREELIEHRRRLGLPVDNLIGLASPDPYSQPTHHRTLSNASSPSTSILVVPGPSHSHARPVPGVPIPRPPSSIHRPSNTISETSTPLSHSPTNSSTSTSPFPFSPPTTSPFPASYVSGNTTLTTPPSSASLASNPAAFPGPAGLNRPLSYPSVPPPSLSSSFGSPSTSYHHIVAPMAIPGRDYDVSPSSPNESYGSRNSPFYRRGSFERRVVESGSLRSLSRNRATSHSRRESVERGARVAETGTLVPRGRPDGASASGSSGDVQGAPASVGAPVEAVPEESESGT